MRRMVTDGDIKEVVNNQIVGSDNISVDMNEDGSKLQISLDFTHLPLVFDFKDVELPDPVDYPDAVTVPGIFNVFQNARRNRKLIYCTGLKTKIGGEQTDAFLSLDENGQFFVAGIPLVYNQYDEVYPSDL